MTKAELEEERAKGGPVYVAMLQANAASKIGAATQRFEEDRTKSDARYREQLRLTQVVEEELQHEKEQGAARLAEAAQQLDAERTRADGLSAQLGEEQGAHGQTRVQHETLLADYEDLKKRLAIAEAALGDMNQLPMIVVSLEGQIEALKVAHATADAAAQREKATLETQIAELLQRIESWRKESIPADEACLMQEEIKKMQARVAELTNLLEQVYHAAQNCPCVLHPDTRIQGRGKHPAVTAAATAVKEHKALMGMTHPSLQWSGS